MILSGLRAKWQRCPHRREPRPDAMERHYFLALRFNAEIKAECFRMPRLIANLATKKRGAALTHLLKRSGLPAAFYAFRSAEETHLCSLTGDSRNTQKWSLSCQVYPSSPVNNFLKSENFIFYQGMVHELVQLDTILHISRWKENSSYGFIEKLRKFEVSVSNIELKKA